MRACLGRLTGKARISGTFIFCSMPVLCLRAPTLSNRIKLVLIHVMGTWPDMVRSGYRRQKNSAKEFSEDDAIFNDPSCIADPGIFSTPADDAGCRGSGSQPSENDQ